MTTERTGLPDDTYDNALVATGGIMAILGSYANGGGALTRVDLVKPGGGNQLDVEFTFLNSPYRITVEQLASPKRQD